MKNISIIKKTSITTVLLMSLFTLTNVAAETVSAPPKATVQAAKTEVFSIEKMTCKMCPITIRKAIEQVPGVSKANVDFESKTATVVFDPNKANVETIALASTNAGYPAKVKTAK